MPRLIPLAAAVALGACLSLPAAAQFAKPEDAVKYRQGSFFVMAQHFGRLGAMVSGRTPYDAAAAQANAEVVAQLAKLPWPAFGAGTEGGKSKPEVWSAHARFKDQGDKLVAESEKLVSAAKAGTLEALKAQFAVTAETCKNCHDTFRNK